MHDDLPTLAFPAAPKLPPLLHARRKLLPPWAPAFATFLFVAAVGVVGIVAAARTSQLASTLEPSGPTRPAAIAASHLRHRARGEWTWADATSCKPPAIREAPYDLGPLSEPRVAVHGDRHACVAYDTTKNGAPHVAVVKLSRRGDFWCADPRAPIACP